MAVQVNGLQVKFIDRKEAKVIFGEESISWNIFPYFKSNNILTYDIFEQINLYLKTLPISVQGQMFEQYRKIYNLLEIPPVTLDKDLKVEVAKLLNLSDIIHTKDWVDLKAPLIVPSVLEEVYEASDENTGNRKRTYDRGDYRWLISLCVLTRLMTPIWGEYIARTGREKGNKFKEYYAAELINDSYLAHCVPMEKLRLFVLENIPKDKSLVSATLAAFSKEDFPEWIIRLVVVKKLGFEDIRGLNNDSHLIKVIFQFIRQKLKNVDGSFLGAIKQKFETESSSTGDDTNNLSKIEGYKIRQELSAGDIALIRKSLHDPIAIGQKLCPGLSVELINQSIANVQELQTQPLEKQQRALLQYVFRPIMSPQGLLLLYKLHLVQCLGVAQAVLWHTGWHDIAALMTAMRIPNDDYLSIGMTGTKSRITKPQLEKLDLLFPYARRLTGKNKNQKGINVAAQEIEKISELFTGNDWKLTIPQAWLNKAEINAKASRYAIPSDVRIRIADFVIAVAQYDFPFEKHKSQLEL